MLNFKLQENLIEKVTFEQQREGSEKINYEDFWENNVRYTGKNPMCKA